MAQGRPGAREQVQQIARQEARRVADRREDAQRIAVRRAEYRQRLVQQPLPRRDVDVRIDNVNFYGNQGWRNDGYRDRLQRYQVAQQRSWNYNYAPARRYNVGQRWAYTPPVYYRTSYFHRPAWQRVSYYRRPAAYYYGGYSDYRYGGGYAYRIDPTTQLIAALLPLFGGAFGVGQVLPVGYGVYNVPVQYRSVYRDDRYNRYRYGDGAIYRIDRRNNRIVGIPAVLTSDFAIGRPAPVGYSVYNVPYGYRDRYYDTARYNYRYNNGRIYQIDRRSQVVLAGTAVFV